MILVDGYNVILRHAPWARLGLADARDHLLALLARTRWPLPDPTVVAVFDAPESSDSQALDVGRIRVRFAAPSADAFIQETIRASDAPERLAVVSDDGEILRTAKSHRVRRYPTAWLFRAAPSGRPGPHAEPPTDDRPLPPGAAERITRELADRWLKRPPSKNR